MTERKNLLTMGSVPVTLVGDPVKVGDKAPDFMVTGNDMKPVRFSELHNGKVTVISVVTSLDTSVCDLQTRRFNQEAVGLSDDVQILTVSMDLPFAQKRWCGGAGIENIKVLSDYKDASFGTSYGVLVKENRLLARSIFVVDPRGNIRYVEQVEENSQQPDYDAALAAVRELL